MEFDGALRRNHLFDGGHHILDLVRGGAAHGVRDPHPIDAVRADRGVHFQQIGKLTPKGVFAGKPHLGNPSGFQELDHLDGLRNDGREIFAMRKSAQQTRRPEQHVHPVHTGLDGPAGVRKRAPDMRENLGLEVRLHHLLTVGKAVFASRRIAHFQIFDPKFAQPGGDVDFVLRRKIGIRELLSFAESGIDNIKRIAISFKVGHGTHLGYSCGNVFF